MKKISPQSSQNLFDVSESNEPKDSPLSARMRPQTLDEYSGQEHILGEGKLLRRAIDADRMNSIILYGPPGTGKTTLSLCISQKTKAHFEKINAVSSNVEELRRVILGSQNRRKTTGRKTILFIDEIHRFNKAQQDVLMPDIENGNLVLIGATVFNPFFSLTGPLLSRSMIFQLEPLSAANIKQIINRALKDEEKGFGKIKITITQEALDFLAEICDGDARKALNALEIAVLTTEANALGIIEITAAIVAESIQKKQVLYDKEGDAHYDTASAFIKSMRGSDPDAAVYWMAKMLYAGEDPRFIARRICICAAEDVGNADPRALILANAALQVSEFIGLPEAKIPLAQAAIYVASAPKSNASYLAINKAMENVKTKKTQKIPKALKDTHYSGAQTLKHGEGYKYAHDYTDHYVDQEYMPTKEIFYEPTDQGFEKEIKTHLHKLKNPPKLS